MTTAACITRGKLAAHFGVHSSTIGRWEATGLIPPARRRNGIRVYSPAEVKEIEHRVYSVSQTATSLDTAAN